MAKSKLTTVPAYYVPYIELIREEELIDALKVSEELWDKALSSVKNNQWEFRYAPGKWTVKEVVQHIIDTERIFCYRALCIARGERKDLAGFDENMYAEGSFSNERSPKEILGDFKLMRASTISMFQSFKPEALQRKGNANGLVVSAELLGFVIVGHQVHHLNVIRDRYLKE